MNNQFSQRVSDIIGYSREEANRLRNNYIGPEHILLGILRDGSGKAIEIFSRLDVNVKNVKLRIEEYLKEHTDEQLFSDTDLSLSPVSARILKMCILEARLQKSNQADTEHLLLAILKDNDNVAAKVLHDFSVYYPAVFDIVSVKTNNPKAGMGLFDVEDEEDMEKDSLYGQQDSLQSASSATKKRKPSNETPVLDKFGDDLTLAAREGKLDPVVGREKEIERVAQILSRRKKNNPVLIGEPGVGKSAIVEGLALRIVQKKVSRILFDKRLVMLNMTSVVAGTKYRGQFEERILSIINELRKNPNVILFIDEIHTIVGAGSAPGAMDAANIMKPALARGEIQCIGATTLSEYRKVIEKDGALERRFQKVLVEPTTFDETLQILKNIKDKYESHHFVSYTDEALEVCVRLTGRYITDRSFPDKAIDAIDEAGSRAHLMNIKVPKEIEEQENLIAEAVELKTNAVKSQNFELAASYRDKENELSARLNEMKSEWESRLQDERQIVDVEDIAQVVSMMSGVPVQRMAHTEGVRLASMKQALQSKVVAQDEAISTLVKAIQRSRVGLKDPNRPIGTFMFLGPTGVGKTHLAKLLAEYMFGSSDALIRIDMSEYMEKFTVSRMIGAAPGYVGYDEGGQLTEKVRRKPYSIVLLDEIEKAHSDVYNILLQVLDEGRLTDNYGRTIDFRNTVIIMTSNIGTRQLKEFGRGVGFTAQTATNHQEHTRNVIQKALNKTFAPEFLNRLDEIVMFDQLSLEAIVRIVDIELASLSSRIETLGYQLKLDDAAKQFLAKKGYDVQFGARPLKRAIQNYVEDAVAEMLVNNELLYGDVIAVSVDEANDKLLFRKA